MVNAPVYSGSGGITYVSEGLLVHFKLLPMLIAAAAGMTMAFQGAINAALAKIIGLLETTFIVQLVGLVFVIVLLSVFQLGEGTLMKVGQVPWFLFVGGILGVAIVYGVARSIPEVGVAPATTAIVVSQLLTAAAIDHTGLFGLKQISFTWYRAGGVLLLAGGAFLLLKK